MLWKKKSFSLNSCRKHCIRTREHLWWLTPAPPPPLGKPHLQKWLFDHRLDAYLFSNLLSYFIYFKTEDTVFFTPVQVFSRCQNAATWDKIYTFNYFKSVSCIVIKIELGNMVFNATSVIFFWISITSKY